jgi:hypothetical protein
MVIGKTRWNSLFLQDMRNNPSGFPWATSTFINPFMGHFRMLGTTPFAGWLTGVPLTTVTPPAPMTPVPPTLASAVVTMASRTLMNLAQVRQQTAVLTDLLGLEQSHQEELSHTLVPHAASESTVSSSMEDQRQQEQLTPTIDSEARLAESGSLLQQSYETWDQMPALGE